MDFADYYNATTKIIERIKAEELDYKTDILQKEKQEIMLEYLELYIYSRLNIFFQYVLAEGRKDNYLFNMEDLQKILSIENFLTYIKISYFKGETFQDRLSNTDLIKYFKK